MATSLMEPPTQPTERRTRTSRPVRNLRIQVRTDDEGVTIRVRGRLDIYTVPALRARLLRHDPTTEHVTLDLTELTLIDSSGLGTLLSYANQARRADRLVRLACDDEFVALLRIARLEDAFDVIVG